MINKIFNPVIRFYISLEFGSLYSKTCVKGSSKIVKKDLNDKW